MITFLATIFNQDGTELLTDVYVRVREVGEEIKSWDGSFEVDQPTIPVGQYRIKLDDGRSGEIWITKKSESDDGKTRMTFLGSGPLS